MSPCSVCILIQILLFQYLDVLWIVERNHEKKPLAELTTINFSKVNKFNNVCQGFYLKSFIRVFF